jgi:hypothetical protein
MDISLGSEETYIDSTIICYQKIGVIFYDIIEMRAYFSLRKSFLGIHLFAKLRELVFTNKLNSTKKFSLSRVVRNSSSYLPNN